MLSTNQILQASYADLLFQDRNKSYGAYQLRQQYPSHLKWAVAIMMTFCLGAFIYHSVFAHTAFKKKTPEPTMRDIVLDHGTMKPPPPVPLPPPASQPQQNLRTESFTPPVIEKDSDVAPEEMPPAQETLDHAVIGLHKADGEDIGNVVAPPVEKRSVAEVVAPKAAQEDTNIPFTRVEVAAEFPGGAQEWLRYLRKHLRFPARAIDNGTQGVVRVQFIVDREGNISEVLALNDPGDGLAEEAVRIIRTGPKWKPAEQNGRKVIYRHIQAITFRLE
ncbi:MAG TPA: energy transducer TonB [Phnomibacter sp.]|nr:energy transducer TonB [Phnomibacter sp.]